MSIMQKLREDQIHTRKHVNELAEYKTVVSLLTTLIGEAAMIGKNDGNRETSDDEVIVVMKKFLKNINETLAVRPKTPGLDVEKILLTEMIEQYGPKQLSEEDLRGTIIKIIEQDDNPNMGSVMKMLKDVYGGEYDGRMASTLTKEILNQ